MPFFQNSVINKYIKSLDKQALQTAYAKFRAHFHNATIQENIRGSKEEQYQGEFLIDLFVNVLGYTKNPTPNFNLTTEYKNVKDSKKADGAIIINEVVKAVIELKGTNTTDLNKIEVQAFGYKNNQPECEYVITSNFEKIRFYIDNAIEYTEFNLFTLTEKEFELLYICLSYESIAKGLPKQIKDESVSQEALITKKLYKDYSDFKHELYHNLVKLNPQYEPLELFKKSQKLLDRFLFIFFAEDRQLLPTNLIFRINKEWQQLKEMRIEVSLYDRYKIYFKDLDQGAKVSLPAFSQTASKQKEEFEIYAYNGGLFKSDDLLNDIKIDDALLFLHTEKLSNYDFASEVDVNVLGHIFENSLNDVDAIKAQLEGQEVDNTKTKRKKDGVFYTPKYITKYIVDNTVGKLCIEKKEELKINEDDYKVNNKRTTKAKQTLLDKLETYRKWLLQLTICDPACGSGAFLNQALDFLISEHSYIDELQAKVLNVPMVLSDIEGGILENNLFGVDINEESVEIAKLSLWLRTAQPNRKLNDLNSNIKCGNSLIDDVDVAGDKAFNWEKEFKQVFSKGGFDVIIGNPPYVPAEYISMNDKIYLEKKYTSAFGRLNLYPIFYEKAILIANKNSKIGFITPYTILKNQYYIQARKFILENTFIDSIIDFKGTLVFSDAAVDSIILLLTKSELKNKEVSIISDVKDFVKGQYKLSNINQLDFGKKADLSFELNTDNIDLEKLKVATIPLSEVLDFNQGVITGNNKEFITNVSSSNTKKVITGSDFNRYSINWPKVYIIYDESKLHRPRKKIVFEASEKILLRQTASYPIASYDNEQFYTLDTVHNGLSKNNEFNLKYFVALLNSKLFRYLYTSSINEEGKVFAQVKIIYVNPLPIKIISIEEQEKFVEIVDVMFSENKKLYSESNNFLEYIIDKFKIETPSLKIRNWYNYDFNEFLKELAKHKIKLSAEDEFSLNNLFKKQKTTVNEIQNYIKEIDNSIDQMVYKLYNLTEEEIKIVENT